MAAPIQTHIFFVIESKKDMGLYGGPHTNPYLFWVRIEKRYGFVWQVDPKFGDLRTIYIKLVKKVRTFLAIYVRFTLNWQKSSNLFFRFTYNLH